MQAELFLDQYGPFHLPWILALPMGSQTGRSNAFDLPVWLLSGNIHFPSVESNTSSRMNSAVVSIIALVNFARFTSIKELLYAAVIFKHVKVIRTATWNCKILKRFAEHSHIVKSLMVHACRLQQTSLLRGSNYNVFWAKLQLRHPNWSWINPQCSIFYPRQVLVWLYHWCAYLLEKSFNIFRSFYLLLVGSLLLGASNAEDLGLHNEEYVDETSNAELVEASRAEVACTVDGKS